MDRNQFFTVAFIFIIVFYLIHYTIGNASDTLDLTRKTVTEEEEVDIVPQKHDLIGPLATSSPLFQFSKNLFAIGASEELAKKSNCIVSGLSLYVALSMTAEGAGGETKSQLEKLLGIQSLGIKKNTESLSLLTNTLNNAKNNQLSFSMANNIWIEKEYQVKSQFLSNIKNGFNVEVGVSDFKKNFESERKSINLWVERKTNGRIPELFPPSSLSSLTRLVLANAIHFKAKWKNEFAKEKTYTQSFNTFDGTVEASYMSQQSNFIYINEESYTAIQLPFVEVDSLKYSMVFVLPQKSGVAPISNLIFDLNWKDLFEKIDRSPTTKVGISIPKFKVLYNLPATDTLKKMKLENFFSRADFSKISDSNDLEVSNVFHQSFLEINEEGGEAAAASGVAIYQKTAISKRITFVLDRPFLFALRESVSNTILFNGLICDPTINK